MKNEHMCDCGKVAFKKTGAGWVCHRCDRIEAELEMRRKKAGRKQSFGKGGVCLIDWKNYHRDAVAICGASLLMLEAKLKAL